MFHLAGISRTSSLGEGISSEPDNSSKRREEEPGYIKILQQGAGSLNIKRPLLIKENQTSPLKEFSAFLCMYYNMLSL